MKISIPPETAAQKRRLSELHRDFLLELLEKLPPKDARKLLMDVKENTKTAAPALTRPEGLVYDTEAE